MQEVVVEKVLQDYGKNVSILFCENTPRLFSCVIPSYPKGTHLQKGPDDLWHATEFSDFDSVFEEIYNVVPLEKIDILFSLCLKSGVKIAKRFEDNPFSFKKIKRSENSEDPLFTMQEITKMARIGSAELYKQMMYEAIRYVLTFMKNRTGSTAHPLIEVYSQVKRFLYDTKQLRISLRQFTAYLSFYEHEFYLEDRDEMYLDSLIAIRDDQSLEQNIYMFVKDKASLPTPFPKYTIHTDISSFDDQQRFAIECLIPEKGRIGIITGGPGTGKTTVLKQIVENMQICYPNERIVMLSPTGKAARRIEEVMGKESVWISTIHNFLGFRPAAQEGKFLPTRDPSKLKFIKETSLIIIDEFSMVSESLFIQLMRYIDLDRVKLLLVGDVDQLPSIDPGCLFSDLIKLGLPTARLKENHRSSGTIVDNAKKIIEGQKDLLFNEQFIITSEDILPTDYLNETDSIILSPYRSANTCVNTDILNLTIHNEKFKNHPPVTSKFRIDDDVIFTATLYHKGMRVYTNGETGKVVTVRSKIVDDSFVEYVYEVQTENGTVEVTQEDIDFSYAVTVHKSQGSEYNTVHIVIPEYSPFITRQMFYTAVTRAKHKVIIHASPETVKRIIDNKKQHERTTTFSLYIPLGQAS